MIDMDKELDSLMEALNYFANQCCEHRLLNTKKDKDDWLERIAKFSDKLNKVKLDERN